MCRSPLLFFSPAFFGRGFFFNAQVVTFLFCSVMDAWGKWTNVSDKVIMAADGNGDFVKATGLVQGKNLPPFTFFYPPHILAAVKGKNSKSWP